MVPRQVTSSHCGLAIAMVKGGSGQKTGRMEEKLCNGMKQSFFGTFQFVLCNGDVMM